MQTRLKLLVAAIAATTAGLAIAQATTGTVRETDRTTGEVARDAATAAGRAASAAVTPGDQNLGRDPQNRSGGLMGTDRTGTGTAPAAGSTPDSSTMPGTTTPSARADRG